MGVFDDAIREHLELKRQHGGSEQELKRQEEEALGRGGQLLEPEQPADEVRAAEPEPEPDQLADEPRAAERPPMTPEPLDVEPDEVLPEDALEVGPSVLQEESLDGERSTASSPGEWTPDEAPEDAAELDEDLLEETPEFLEEAPGQDRLWFEQKPPKDFDFDD